MKLSPLGSIILTLFLNLPRLSDSIILLDLSVPPFVREGDSVVLKCVYDLEYDGLYSLKWYKDGVEFYSYIPRMKDGSKQRFFDLPGVHIEKKQADEKQVVLSNVSILATEGNYKCQVSGEGPLFATASQTKKLRVAKVPEDPPLIPNADKTFLKLGDWLSLNCTSGFSRPPVRLTWIVNGREASDKMIRRFNQSPSIKEMKEIAAIDKTDLTQSIVGLQFWVTSEHFELGKLKVKCLGSIPSVYSEESDTFIVGEHDGPQHKVLQATSSGADTSLRRSGKKEALILMQGMKGFLPFLPFKETKDETDLEQNPEVEEQETKAQICGQNWTMFVLVLACWIQYR